MVGELAKTPSAVAVNRPAEEDDIFDVFADSLFLAMFMVAVLMFMFPVMVQAFERHSSYIQSQMYVGGVDSRMLDADGTLKYVNLTDTSPFMPWVSADFHNYGPDKVYIGINNPGSWLEKESGETLQVNMIGASRRIETIFYKCDVGCTARVRADGKY